MTQYTGEFYRIHRDGSRRSAEAVVPVVVDLVRPGSVVDVGCGVGVWLSVFRRHGIEDVVGIDGSYVDRNLLEIPPERFRSADLRGRIRLHRRFDLVVSLEVAEHLPPETARAFIESLTMLGPIVLFSAAIPHQGGVGHVNEQWPDYWAERFREYGYVAMDCIRPKIWRDDSVDWWYAQNTLLYAEHERVARHPHLRAAQEATGEVPLSMVHPRKYLAVLDWLRLVHALRCDFDNAVPPGSRVIFVDEEQLRAHVCPEAFPFTEQEGQYAGPPADDATALRELHRLRQEGAVFIAFASPAFWWLEYYRHFSHYLRANFRCVLDNERLVVFDLRRG
jgi:SAM-dependent methyltransferase